MMKKLFFRPHVISVKLRRWMYMVSNMYKDTTVNLKFRQVSLLTMITGNTCVAHLSGYKRNLITGTAHPDKKCAHK